MPVGTAARAQREARRAGNRRRRLLLAKPDRIPAAPAGSWCQALGVGARATPRRTLGSVVFIAPARRAPPRRSSADSVIWRSAPPASETRGFVHARAPVHRRPAPDCVAPPAGLWQHLGRAPLGHAAGILPKAHVAAMVPLACGAPFLDGAPVVSNRLDQFGVAELFGAKAGGVAAEFVARGAGLTPQLDPLAPHRQHLPAAAGQRPHRPISSGLTVTRLSRRRSSRWWPFSHATSASGGKSLLGQQAFGAFEDATLVAF